MTVRWGVNNIGSTLSGICFLQEGLSFLYTQLWYMCKVIPVPENNLSKTEVGQWRGDGSNSQVLSCSFFLAVPKDVVFPESPPTKHYFSFFFFSDTLRLLPDLPAQKRSRELFTQGQLRLMIPMIRVNKSILASEF